MGIPAATDSVTCRLCGKEYRSINYSHLRRAHRFRTAHPVTEYKRRFGLRWAASEDCRDKIRRAKVDYYEREGRHWTQERILKCIRTRHARGQSLVPARLKASSLALYEAAHRLLGGWRPALQAAGLDPERHFAHPPPLSRKELLRALRMAYRRGDLRRGTRMKANNSRLVSASFRTHGSWLAALREAGVPRLYRPQVRWTKLEVARQIRRRLREGRTILGKDVQGEERRLYKAAVALFRSPWADVIESLGFRYPGRRTWTSEKVIAEIGRLKRSGKPLNRDFVERQIDASFVHVAVRRFGSWDGALRAARLDPTRIRREARRG